MLECASPDKCLSWHAVWGFRLSDPYPRDSASLKTALLPDSHSHIYSGLSADAAKVISLTYDYAKDVTYLRLDQESGSIFYGSRPHKIKSLILGDQLKRGIKEDILVVLWL